MRHRPHRRLLRIVEFHLELLAQLRHDAERVLLADEPQERLQAPEVRAHRRGRLGVLHLRSRDRRAAPEVGGLGAALEVATYHGFAASNPRSRRASAVTRRDDLLTHSFRVRLPFGTSVLSCCRRLCFNWLFTSFVNVPSAWLFSARMPANSLSTLASI